tara:strand:+ start:211 stop:408 length:198 start_codon:yes stop_codon:yes gene_type:complete
MTILTLNPQLEYRFLKKKISQCIENTLNSATIKLETFLAWKDYGEKIFSFYSSILKDKLQTKCSL